MSFQEKNISVTLVSFSLILIFYTIRLFQMATGDGLNSAELFRLWGIVIFFGIIVTIIGMILTHGVSAAIEAIKTGNDDPDIEDIEDERDKLIDLRGTKVTHNISSIGGFFAMLSFVLGQSPLVMFALFILFGLISQVAGDIYRLVLYRRGF